MPHRSLVTCQLSHLFSLSSFTTTLAGHPRVPCGCLHCRCVLGLGISLAQPVRHPSPAGPMPLHSSKPGKLGAWDGCGVEGRKRREMAEYSWKVCRGE
ncbi:hypothetical protein B0H14DRAFT_2679271 [Mycena olivaceomarginata]|nr:hypothetical protein B0H14DRAFT_2679271 [Mycena olivaceomarginata]